MFYGNSATTFAAITDGLSNTGFYSERIVGDGDHRNHQPDRRRLLRSGAPLTPADAMAQCQALNIYNPANQIPMIMGVPWIDGQHIFLHVTPPNTRSCGFFIVNRAVMPPSSKHPGGVNTAFRRRVGQVHQELDQSANLAVRLGPGNGGEVISSDSY